MIVNVQQFLFSQTSEVADHLIGNAILPWGFLVFYLSDGAVQLMDGELRCHAGVGDCFCSCSLVSILMSACFSLEISSRLSSRKLSASKQAALFPEKIWQLGTFLQKGYSCGMLLVIIQDLCQIPELLCVFLHVE